MTLIRSYGRGVSVFQAKLSDVGELVLKLFKWHGALKLACGELHASTTKSTGKACQNAIPIHAGSGILPS